MIRRALQSVLLPLGFCCAALILGCVINAYQYDSDEGLNLIKSLLLLRGHALYAEIWSDQPPVFTFLLAGLFKLTAPSVMAARILVLMFSFLLLWSFQRIVEILEDRRHALAATLILAGTTWYAVLSFSVMIGLPALSLATLSVWILAEYRRRSSLLLAGLSGVVFAVSIQTKLFTALLIPMMVMLCVVPLPQKLPAMPWSRRLAGLGLVAVACAATFAGISLWAHIDFEQLTTTHQVASELGKDWGTPQALLLLRRDWHLLILISISALMLRREGLGRRLLPFVWLVTAAIGLQFHRPVWKHHSLLLTIPASWAGAEAVLMLWRRSGFAWPIAAGGPVVALEPPVRSTWARLATCGLACWLTFATIRAFARLLAPELDDAEHSMEVIEANAAQTKWIFSDRLMAPFRAGLSVPPPLAVVSVKRQGAGQLSDSLIVATLQKYRPEQIAIGRLAYGSTVLKFIAENYSQIWQSPTQTIYLRADLQQSMPN